MLLRQAIRYICFIALLGVTACATNNIKTQQVFDFKNLGRIELQITANDPSALSESVGAEVGKNLADWNYPVGAKDGAAFSHVLKATVESVEYGNTPPGFSFSSGNSDPRAMDFQKTFVLPITCQLTSIDHPEQTSELKLGFSADQTSKFFLSSDKLADHISTVCFNLLTELKWPEKPKKDTDEKTIKSPGWIPEIRIETKETPPTESVHKLTPIKNSSDKVDDVESSTPSNAEPRKQIIIYNQGSPVILELGHQRR